MHQILIQLTHKIYLKICTKPKTWPYTKTISSYITNPLQAVLPAITKSKPKFTNELNPRWSATNPNPRWASFVYPIQLTACWRQLLHKILNLPFIWSYFHLLMYCFVFFFYRTQVYLELCLNIFKHVVHLLLLRKRTSSLFFFI